MNLRLRTEAFRNALANLDEAIKKLETLREQQKQHEGRSPASLEMLVTERETVKEAITHIEKLLYAPPIAAPVHQDTADNDLPLRRKCGPVWSRSF